MNKNKIVSLVSSLIAELGEDVNREGLKDTPRRVAEAYAQIYSGYSEKTKLDTSFVMHKDLSSSNLITISSIRFYSICEHHLLPFFGNITIEYKPNGKVLGASKFVRICNHYARRMQIQERLTQQVLEEIVGITDTEYCKVSITAKHLCMMMRGVENDTAEFNTSAEHGHLNSNI